MQKNEIEKLKVLKMTLSKGIISVFYETTRTLLY